MAFTPEQERSYGAAEGLLERHGYFIAADLIDGSEDLFLDDIWGAAKRVEEFAKFLRKRYGFRGISKRLVEELHISLPAPSFNVESAVAQELRAKWNRQRKV